MTALFVAYHASTTLKWRLRTLRKQQTAAFWSERRATAVLLHHAAARGTVFCDLERVEVLSNLPVSRVLDWRGNDVTERHLREQQQRTGTAFVVSSPQRVGHLRAVTRVLYEDQQTVILQVL